MGFLDIFKRKEDIKLEKLMRLEDELTLLSNEVKNMGVKIANLEKRVFANEMAERRAQAKEKEEGAYAEIINLLNSISSDGKIDIKQILPIILKNPDLLKKLL